MWTEMGWVPDEMLGGFPSAPTIPPQYIRDELARMGVPWDATKYQWDPLSMSLVDRASGAKYSYAGVADPSLGTDVVTNLSAYNANGRPASYATPDSSGNFGFPEGMNPYIAFPGESYNAGLLPNSGFFVSGDPSEIDAYKDAARTRSLQGVARIGALVGGGALAGNLLGPAGVAGTTPGAAAAPVVADGLSPITVGASMLPGGTGAGVSAVNAAFGGAPLAGAGGGVLGNIGGFMRNNASLIGGVLGAADALSQPDSMTTNQGGTSSSTYSATLPSEITGPAGEALASLRGIYGNGGPGVDPVTSDAIQRLRGFGGTVNPYLDTVFNTAANATQGRLASEFARSGRNVGGVDHQGFRSDELQQLAAGIYGPGFEAERSREFAAQPELIRTGDYLRNLPFSNLMQYLSGLQGLMPFFPGSQTQNTEQTGSVTQPLFNNPWAGFLGGAQLGQIFAGA